MRLSQPSGISVRTISTAPTSGPAMSASAAPSTASDPTLNHSCAHEASAPSERARRGRVLELHHGRDQRPANGEHDPHRQQEDGRKEHRQQRTRSRARPAAAPSSSASRNACHGMTRRPSSISTRAFAVTACTIPSPRSVSAVPSAITKATRRPPLSPSPRDRSRPRRETPAPGAGSPRRRWGRQGRRCRGRAAIARSTCAPWTRAPDPTPVDGRAAAERRASTRYA